MRLTLSRPDYLYDNDLLNQCLCDIFIRVWDYCFNFGLRLDAACIFWLILIRSHRICVTVKLHHWTDFEAFVWILAGNGSLTEMKWECAEKLPLAEFLIRRRFSRCSKSGRQIKQINMLQWELVETATVEYLSLEHVGTECGCEHVCRDV